MKGSVGGPLAGLAAILTVVAAFSPFWDGTKAYDVPLRGLWEGYTGLDAEPFLASIALVLLVGGVILLASTVAGSQFLSFLGFAWVTALLTLFVHQAHGTDTVATFLVHEVDWGFWVAAAGALLALTAGFVSRSVSTGFRR